MIVSVTLNEISITKLISIRKIVSHLHYSLLHNLVNYEKVYILFIVAIFLTNNFE